MIGYKIIEPTGKATVLSAADRSEVHQQAKDM